MLPESKLDPVESLPTFEKLKLKPDPRCRDLHLVAFRGRARLLKKTLVLKLNGGLGTGMGSSALLNSFQMNETRP